MNGLTIVGGINLSGKGAVLNELQKLWRERFPLNPARFETLSNLMQGEGGISGYDGLASLDKQFRHDLRNRCLSVILEEASNYPYFLDTHFVFEDGEIPDLSSVMSITRQIVFVLCNAEEIKRRAVNDPNVEFHPGRRVILDKGTDFIRAYQERELQAAKSCLSTIPFLTDDRLLIVDNSGSLPILEESIATIFPLIEGNYRQTMIPGETDSKGRKEYS